MSERTSGSSAQVERWSAPGSEAVQRLKDELVVAHELGHALLGEVAGMTTLGFSLEFAAHDGSVAYPAGHARIRRDGAGPFEAAMGLAGGVLAQDLWAQLRGGGDDARRFVFRDTAEATAHDTGFIAMLEREHGVDRSAVFRAVEGALAQPEMRGALAELVLDVMRDVPRRRVRPVRIAVPGDYIRQVLERHGVARAAAIPNPPARADRGERAASEQKVREAARVPGIGRAVKSAAEAAHRGALGPGPSAERFLKRSLPAPARRPDDRTRAGRVTPAGPAPGR
ncbi:hypothetical protein LG943_12515 [Streptomonospora sp. S1-112]|uniref:Uncharacterized protein n=1 Tax=Streptomonospora mangrovi TaxID=2883123 RepID=A0A9X3SEN0_9ACTN|nr:hypothetical protein [Streptomonospora mangrovi]MDA0565137.1 hypothetical protein [Streptomonospora mangrovi]